jgi:hypothetical protein
MRSAAVLVTIGAIWLLGGLDRGWGASAGPPPMTQGPHSPPVLEPQERQGQEPVLRLPVHMVWDIPLRPAVGGETFYMVSFLLDYTGGPVTLAGDAAGTLYTSVDDELTMRVTHADGTTSQYRDMPDAERLPPMDLSQHFRAGVNRVDVELRDVYGDIMSSTDLWLSAQLPRPSRLPLTLFEGAHPQSYWPAQEMMGDVSGPPRGWKVMLAGDPDGLTGTWAACVLEIRVKQSDGSSHTFSYDYCSRPSPAPAGTDQSPTDGLVQTRPPADVTSLFGPGVNHVEAQLRNEWGGPVASSPVWLALVRNP